MPADRFAALVAAVEPADGEIDVERVPDDVTRLRRCLIDLVGVLALPATWTGRDASRVATALLDGLVRMLALDFAFLKLDRPVDGEKAAWGRASGRPDANPADGLGAALAPYLHSEAPTAALRVPHPIAAGTASIALFHLGLEDRQGVFVAGSARPDFPTTIERLLLQVATNQAAMGLQEAYQASRSIRATEELEERVAARTAELTAANEALTREVGERRRAEERIREKERELRLLVDFVPQLIVVLAPDGAVLSVNRAGVEYLGRSPDDLARAGDVRAELYHPDDVDGVRRAVRGALADGAPCEIEARLRRHDGRYRWFAIRYEPLRDAAGAILRWYATGLDVDDRRAAEERVREENLALREEVDKASRFTEIVGVSAPLRAVLAQVAKVAPTESTVLLTGETGTGKELIARAIHKRSRRASRVFVSVNCAAIPPGLVASELFGHERGAFTGALQRRPGRFEVAEGGTIFLDEVGELPMEMQLALLRVLQEREFERVGGGRPIRSNVRVLAATNRNLEAAMEEGRFRPDLYYRLNVFPLAVPPLRDRCADIPELVHTFVDRYSRDAGKRIERVTDHSMELLHGYRWPGNVRELQNVIERSVILCEGETLTVDERWFLSRPGGGPAVGQSLSGRLSAQGRALIESALAETRGLVSGPSGAAAKLGLPPSTLESKIKALGIDKKRFKRTY